MSSIGFAEAREADMSALMLLAEAVFNTFTDLSVNFLSE